MSQVVATRTGEAVIDGERITFTEGETRFDADHPVVREMPDAFRPVEAPEVEQATAAPGEKRGSSG